MKPSLIFLLILFMSACSPQTNDHALQASLGEQEQYTLIYLFRHAEKDLTSPGANSRDPNLSMAGKARAAQLAHVLMDAGVNRIFSSDYIRTRSTVTPLAKAIGVETEIYNARELEPFANQLKGMKGTIAVSGHSNTTPTLVRLLGGDPGPPIEEKTEYDRLYVVFLKNGKAVHSILMRYGEEKKK